MRRYVMWKSHQDAGSFVPWSGCDKLIINLVDSDHGWRDTVICVSGPGRLPKPRTVDMS